MGKNLKYGEFTFSAPKARPTVAGYAHGGQVAMKKGGETKGQAKVAKVMGEFKSGALHSGSSKGPIVKNPKQAMAIALSEKQAAGYKKGGNAKSGVKEVKLVGMKMEPEAVVKKEVALLKKAGAPAKLIKHEEREGALMGLKKGGKPKRYQEGGSAESDIAPGSSHSFREVNGKYMHNNEEVSKADFDRRRAAVDARIQRMRGPDTSKMSPKDRAKSAFDELDAEVQKSRDKPYKKGGKACYAEGGGVMTEAEMARENARQKSIKPPAKGAGAMTERERQMMEETRGQKMDRDMERARREHYSREEAENRADRKAAQDALMYIPRKIGEGARSAYDAVMGKKKGGEVHSDVAMDKKVIKKAVHKHEAAMHPGKPMTKLKKGGDVKGYAIGGMLANPRAPMVAAPAGGRQAPAYAQARNAPAGRPGLAGGALAAPRAPVVAAQSNRSMPAYAQSSAGGASAPMKKGGSAKKGVPVHNRTPKC